MNARFNILYGLVAAVMPVYALAATTADRLLASELISRNEATRGPSMTIPLTSWPVDTKSFIEQRRATSKAGNLKAATDRATVYRPIPVCRLIDTRGNPAWVTITGPLTPGVTNVPAAGRCGIPGVGVAGLSISFHVLNLTPFNGGTIAFLQQGIPPPGNGVNAVFNPGADWTAATANISLPDDSGNFEIIVASSTIQLVVDVNGYYQDLDFVDIGAQELDIVGNVTDAGGDAFEVANNSAGGAIAADNFGGGPALRIYSGSIAVAGAAVGSGTAAFIFQVNTGNLCDANTAPINHPMLDGDANALLLLTPRGAGALTGAPVTAIYNAAGAACTNHWAVRGAGALANGAQYSALIIKAQ